MARSFSVSEAKEMLTWYDSSRAVTAERFKQVLDMFDSERADALNELKTAMNAAIEKAAAEFISKETGLTTSSEPTMDAARKLARGSISPDDEPIRPAAEKLLAIDAAKEKASALFDEYTAKLDRASQKLDVATSTLKWLFSTQQTKQGAEKAFEELSEARGVDDYSELLKEAEALLLSALNGEDKAHDAKLESSAIQEAMEEAIPLSPVVMDSLVKAASAGKITKLLNARTAALQVLDRVGNSDAVVKLRKSVPSTIRVLRAEQGISNNGSKKALLSTNSKTKASTQLVLDIRKLIELEYVEKRAQKLFSSMLKATSESNRVLLRFRDPIAAALAGDAEREEGKKAYELLKHSVNGQDGLSVAAKEVAGQFKAACSITKDVAWQYFIAHSDEITQKIEDVAPGRVEDSKSRRRAERMALRSERERERLAALAQMKKKSKESKAGVKKQYVTSGSVVPIHVNQFLVRRSYGSHDTGGHKLENIRAVVCILPKDGGDVRAVEFDGYYCPKCDKCFLMDDTYYWLKRKGYICCRVVEERELNSKRGLPAGPYSELRDESIAHQYGYTVSQQQDLSDVARRDILSFMIANRIQSTQEIAKLLEWLIHSGEGRRNMRVAVEKWRSDLEWVRKYNKPTRRVIVDSIFARI